MHLHNPDRVGKILFAARNLTNAQSYPHLSELRQEYGLPPLPPGARRLTQADTAILAGLATPGTGPTNIAKPYALLERGRPDKPAEKILPMLRAVATVLGMDQHAYDSLLIAARGGPALAEPLDPVAAGLHVAPTWQAVIDAHPRPAYISNFQWQVKHFNLPAQRLFGIKPENMMRWMLSIRPYETSIYRMPRPEQWLPPAASQLRNALDAYPNDEVLKGILADVLDHDERRLLYESYPEPYSHPDGDVRLMRDARGRVGVLTAAAAMPMGSPGWRALFMDWTPLPPESRNAATTHP